MANKLYAAAFLTFIVLAGCGGGDRANITATAPAANAPLPQPSPYERPGYYYHGLLWGSMAGTEYFYRSSNCVYLESLAIAGYCIDAITQDGIESADATLRTGLIIELNAGFGTNFGWGNGAAVDIQRTVVGPIETIDADHLQLTVLGQQVYVTDQTQGNSYPPTGGLPFDFARVATGDYVSVSGHFTDDGQVLATLIENASGSEPLLLRGVLNSQSGSSYRIGEQQIDFAGADFEGFDNGMPASGDTVLLRADTAPQGGVLVARSVRNAGGLRDTLTQQSGKFLFDGFLTAARGLYDFEIAGYRFNYATWDCGGCENVSDQTVGKLVSFYTDPGENLILDLNPPTWNGTYLIGPVDSVDVPGASLMINGFNVQTNPGTVISTADVPWISAETLLLSDLAVGDVVTVTGGVRLVPGVDHWLPDERMVAGSIVTGGDGIQVHTQLYERAEPEIIFLGRDIVTDAGTTVTACDGNGVCIDTGPAWLFANTDYFQPVLTIDIEPGSSPMRASHILAVQDP